jgi:RNA polymerase sigma factor (sigma-70 family)
MLVDEPSIKDSLSRIARRMVSNAALHEDLLQEALMHLWLIEARRPGQTRSWYLHSCRFHLQHYLASGRSVDSRKRRHREVRLSFENDEITSMPDHFDADTAFLAQVCAREMMSLLSNQLKPRAQAILTCLSDGMGTREIARKLRISHPTVIKYRRKIAALALKLGISAPPSNGHNNHRKETSQRGSMVYPGISRTRITSLSS